MGGSPHPEGMAGEGANGGTPDDTATCGRELVLGTEGIIVESEDELRALAGVSVIHGNLSLLTNVGLDLLSCLTTVDGNLEIYRPEGTTLHGLDALTHVGGELLIHDNALLENLNGLGSLATVGGSLRVWGHALLKSLSGLTSLSAVTGELDVDTNPSLEGLEGIERLEKVGDLGISSNQQLTSLTGLVALRRAGGLFIEDNDRLEGLAGLEAIEQTGDVWLAGSNLKDLTALGRLTSLTGSLIVVNIGPSLEGLHNIESVDGNVYIDSQVTSLDGLRGLRSISGDLTIEASSAHDLAGLGPLSVARDVTVSGGFQTLSGIENITIGHSLNLVDCAELLDLSPLSSLTSLNGSFVIGGNAGLTDLEGLENLTTIGGDLSIERWCRWLSDVTAPFTSCNSNTFLSSLHGLRGLTHLGGSLLIEDNPALPTCEAEWLRDHIGSDALDGTVTISGNDDTGTCAP